MDNKNLYQGLIKKFFIIRILRQSKDHQIVIEKKPDPSPNVSKESDTLMIPGNYETVQHNIPINKSGPQDIFSLWRK